MFGATSRLTCPLDVLEDERKRRARSATGSTLEITMVLRTTEVAGTEWVQEHDVMAQGVPDFAELLRGAERTAVHLEMRDVYSVGDETEAFERFHRTGETDLNPDSEFWTGWTPIVREPTGACSDRGRFVRLMKGHGRPGSR
ncbi:DUF6879 family protein [Streptomyces sp. NPDC086023]|uniref:DUF6879 family protein n=1 Tax=Streptomyces sp. NPDC086023 TaxID=3365746 RepID=UPI0037D8AF17